MTTTIFTNITKLDDRHILMFVMDRLQHFTMFINIFVCFVIFENYFLSYVYIVRKLSIFL